MTKTQTDSASAQPETLDVLELLYMLTRSGRTGVLCVQRELEFKGGEEFRAWLHTGRIRQMEFGTLVGVEALAELVSDSRGRFHFDEGAVYSGPHPDPQVDLDMDTLAMDILVGTPLPEVLFAGPARASSPQRLAQLPLTVQQQQTLAGVEAGLPLNELADDPETSHFLARLIWLGLLVPRKSRVARLTVGATRQVKGRVIIDEIILRRWQDDLGTSVKQVAVRDAQNIVYTLPVMPGPLAGVSLLLPPELLIATRLNVGDTVLVQPFID
jgi:Domain of unknown function (DUF4388)